MHLHFRADTCRWLARWKHSAAGLPYQWRQCCVTHRERTSCSTTLLLFLLHTAAIALSVSFLLLLSSFVFVAVRTKCGAGQWSTPSDSFVPLWMHLGLTPVSTLVVCFSLDFHWLLRSTLVRLLSWTLSPESCFFEVSDEPFSSSSSLLRWWFLSVETKSQSLKSIFLCFESVVIVCVQAAS